MGTAQNISLNELTQTLIDLNQTQIDQFEALLDDVESATVSNGSGSPISGVLASLLRNAISTRNTANNTLLTNKGELQVATVDGFFPPSQ